MAALRVTPGVVIPDDELIWSAVRASGPGGQNVNRVATKVELRFRPGRSRVLSDAQRERVLDALSSRVTRDGWLVVGCDTTRSQAQNLALARERLADWLREGLRIVTPRRPTRPTRASRLRRLDDKAHASKRKATRRAPVD